ncbi:hypothetical protein CBM2623_A100078 [Cupriavidus taiwanensis]|nr:hypothetical protein CBM2623_A100078 [Cupriavidus taiwanensis]
MSPWGPQLICGVVRILGISSNYVTYMTYFCVKTLEFVIYHAIYMS